MNEGSSRDFFISYTSRNEDWARWLDAELTRAGYSVYTQALDFRPGNDFVHEMQRAATGSGRILAVLSPAYLGSEFGESEWRVAFAADPTGERGVLVPVRVETVQPPGLLATRVYIDLVGVDEETAREKLLAGIAPPTAERPTSARFPGSVATPGTTTEPKPFPGRARPVQQLDPRDRAAAIAEVVDGSGAVHGRAFLIGGDVAVTCRHVVDACGADGARLRWSGGGSEPVEVLESDSEERIDAALLRIGPVSGRTPLTFGLEDRGVVGRTVVLPGPAADGDEVPSAVVTDRTVSAFLVLSAVVPAGPASGSPVVDSSGAVIGVLRCPGTGTELQLVPFSEIARRWPALAALDTAGPIRYYDVIGSVPETLAASAWEVFDPARLHCVVVNSESSLVEPPLARLDRLVGDMFSSPDDAAGVWRAFTDAAGRSRLVSSTEPRRLPHRFKPSSVRRASFSVVDAFDTERSLELAARLIVEADLVFVDVTHFEPGIMLLLGVRAATRRGVTIVSHGDGWEIGEPLPRPFNLADLSLASHTISSDKVGKDPKVQPTAERVINGFTQLARRPGYQDLPVFDALRLLGSDEETRRTIPLDDEVLVLCPYHDDYKNWTNLRSQIARALFEADQPTRSVVRLQDMDDPALVSDSLYNRIRRCRACVADWTWSSASTFFELGVRIAVSPWGIVQIVSTDWVGRFAGAAGDAPRHTKRQFDLMLKTLNPVQYGGEDDSDIGRTIAGSLLALENSPERQGEHGLRRVAARALSSVDRRLPDVAGQLREEAESLHDPDQREAQAKALFYEVPAIKRDRERGACERRVAAWLYLDRRMGAGELPEDDPVRRSWQELGDIVVTELLGENFGSVRDIALADEIEKRLGRDD